MQQGLRIELQRIAALAVALAAIGFANGYTLATLLVGGSLYMAWFLVKINRLYRWLEHGGRSLPPDASGVWGDVSNQLYRHRQRNARIQQSYRAVLQRVRKITSALDEGIVVLNAHHCVTWWNPPAARLLRLRKADLGTPVTNLLRAPQFVDFIRRGRFEQAVEVHAIQGENRSLQFSGSHFGDNEIALVIRDVTHLRRLEQTRKEFVANISHELRTPLTVLIGYIETLRESGDPRWQRALDQMAGQAARMNVLADDLVMLSQLEATAAPLVNRPLQLDSLLQPIIDSAVALSAGRHRISLQCAAHLSLTGDAKELHSAFANLIYNAVAHNPAGCDIVVQVAASADSLTVAVADNGVGIDPRHLPRLTERFYRVDDSRAASTGGSGLGLAIVKHVLLRHHGQLEIDSAPGKGSTFTCRFRLS